MTAVVFVHGFLGGSRQWHEQIAALGDAFDVTTVDLPGFGENAHLAAPEDIADYARWVLDALQSRGVDRFHLIGHSMGGMVVQDMIAQAPERVDRLVLYGTGASGVLPGRFETIAASKRRAADEGAAATARRIAATWFLEEKGAAAYADCAAIAAQGKLDAILAGLDAMQGWSGVAHLPKIKAKTLIVWGDHDRTYSWAQTAQLWQSIENASIAVIPDCAHAAHLEKPGLFNQIIRDFLQS